MALELFLTMSLESCRRSPFSFRQFIFCRQSWHDERDIMYYALRTATTWHCEPEREKCRQRTVLGFPTRFSFLTTVGRNWKNISSWTTSPHGPPGVGDETEIHSKWGETWERNSTAATSRIFEHGRRRVVPLIGTCDASQNPVPTA